MKVWPDREPIRIWGSDRIGAKTDNFIIRH